MIAVSPDRVETLRAVTRTLGTFARQVELKRALEAEERKPHINFWRVVYGGLSNLAVIEWCKLFGGEGSNALHWKRVYADRQDEFRTGLHAAVAMDASAFSAYWRAIKTWRDVDFAHFEPDADRPTTWPHFGAAVSAADYYYGWVVGELDQAAHYMFPRDLAGYRNAVRIEFDNAAALALASTRALPPSKT